MSLCEHGRSKRDCEKCSRLGSPKKSQRTREPTGPELQPKICMYFERDGKCFKGDNCRYSHLTRHKSEQTVRAKSPLEVNRGICFQFVRTGRCSFGQKCKFRHPDAENGSGATKKKSLKANSPKTEQGGGKNGRPSTSKGGEEKNADKQNMQIGFFPPMLLTSGEQNACESRNGEEMSEENTTSGSRERDSVTADDIRTKARIDNVDSFKEKFFLVLSEKTPHDSLLQLMKEDLCLTEAFLQKYVDNQVVGNIRELLQIGEQDISDDRQEMESIKKAFECMEKERWIAAMDFLESRKSSASSQSQSQMMLITTMRICKCMMGMEDEAETKELASLPNAKQKPCIFQVELLELIIHTLPHVRKGQDNYLEMFFSYALLLMSHPTVKRFQYVVRVCIGYLREFSKLCLTEKMHRAVTNENLQGTKDARDRASGSPAMEKMSEMVGMDLVKERMLDIRDMFLLRKERNETSRDDLSANLNAIFTGNPGTGKTSTARIYAEMLAELDVIPIGGCKETGLGEFSSKDDKKLSREQRQLVIHDIESSSETNLTVLRTLIEAMKNDCMLILVLTGGRAEVDKMLGRAGENFASRFRIRLDFPDFDDDQLYQLLTKTTAGLRPPMHFENDKYPRIAAKRLGKGKGSLGFGNARSVHNMFEYALERQARRITMERETGLSPDITLISRDDLLGPRRVDLNSSKAFKRLSSMIGLRQVKEQILQLRNVIETNFEREELGIPAQDLCLNRLFLGSPGTGKSETAKIYALLLKELGILSKGQVLLKNPSDFVGKYIGHSESQTNAILDAAEGNVLVIDEAYGLFKRDVDVFRSGVVDTIVSRVQGKPGEDICVLLLGYREEMEACMRDGNPGLQRRFQMENAFIFEDFTAEEMLKILLMKAKERGLELPYNVAREAVKVLETERRTKNFGNGGAAENLLARSIQAFEKRTAEFEPHERATMPLLAGDFLKESGRKALARRGNPESIFEDLVGCDHIVEVLRAYMRNVVFARKTGRDPLDDCSLNFAFMGPPGTGKTTIAKRLGMMLHAIDILPSDKVVECSASAFSTGYVGQAAKKTRKLFESAIGGVLFIDEAYRLYEPRGHSYMQETVDEIVQLLTEDSFMNKMAVVFAGYDEEMETMLRRSNRGLASRVSERLLFKPFSPKDCKTVLENDLQGKGFKLSGDAAALLPKLLARLVRLKDYANLRDVKQWAKKIRTRVASELANVTEVEFPGGCIQVRRQWVQESFEDFVEGRERRH